MKELAMTLDLRNDPTAIATYRKHHQQVWPEVLAALREVGVMDMRIWLRGNRMFMLMEVKDDFNPDFDFPRYLTLHPRCQEWEDLMGTFQQPLPDSEPGEKWVEMEKVFHMREQG